MLRTLLLVVAGVFALVAVPAIADDKKPDEKKTDKKEVKLEGEMVCGKCALKETKECSNVLQVKDGDKKVTYYLDDKGAKEDYHKMCCTKTAKVTVTGEVSEKDGKKTIKAAKVEEKKQEKSAKEDK